jgi:hypothetical protein
MMLAEMVIVLGAKYFRPGERMPNPPSPEAGYSNTKELGRTDLHGLRLPI